MYICLMKRETIGWRIISFYLEGFREMKLGKILWLIILLKLFILFFVLKFFFFPDYLAQFGEEAEKEEYVSNELINRASMP